MEADGMAEYPKRKRNRLAGYDYSAPGAYFVTVCTHEKRCILGDVAVGEGLAPPAVRLTSIGRVVESQILALPHRYPSLSVVKYVIMPNHVHLLLTLDKRENTGGASPSPTDPGMISCAGGASPSPTDPGMISCAGGASPSSTIPDMVCALKSLSSRQAKPDLSGMPLWQRSFHDHVIRNDQDYQMIWKYIDENPARWADDCFYSS